MFREFFLYFFILFTLKLSAMSVVKDTCYMEHDSINSRTLKICKKEQKTKHGHPYMNYPSTLFISRGGEEAGILWVCLTKRYITVYQKENIIYKSYSKVKRKYNVFYETKFKPPIWPKREKIDITTIRKCQMTKWNSDSSKETLVKINKHLDYRHALYDSQGKKIKTEIINTANINWNEWRFEKE